MRSPSRRSIAGSRTRAGRSATASGVGRSAVRWTMFSRSWVAQVGSGLLLVGIFGALTIAGAQEANRLGSPLELTVSDAEARLVADTKLDHVRLTDLMLTCTDRENRSGRIYVSALGEQPLPDVLVEFDASEDCEAGPLRVAGRLERRWRTADGRPAATDVPRTLLFHPHTDDLVWLAMSTALTILGGVLMWSGLWRRRAERERLRKATEPGPVLAPQAGQEGDPYRQEEGSEALLSRPLRPDKRWFRRARRGSSLGLALGGVLLATMLLWAGVVTRDVIRVYSMWSSGVPASAVAVHGLEPPLPPPGTKDGRTASFINIDRLVVVYTDGHGRRHHGSYSRKALFSPIYEGRSELRYDPDDPSSFAVSTVREGLRGELLLLLLVFAAVVPGTLRVMRAPRRRLRELEQLRETLHSSPEEVILPVLSVHRLEFKGDLVSTDDCLHLPDGATLTESFAEGERPLFVEIDESRVLGLRRTGQPGRVVVLREDLSPLVADEHEAERVRLRYRRGRGERPVT